MGELLMSKDVQKLIKDGRTTFEKLVPQDKRIEKGQLTIPSSGQLGDGYHGKVHRGHLRLKDDSVIDVAIREVMVENDSRLDEYLERLKLSLEVPDHEHAVKLEGVYYPNDDELEKLDERKTGKNRNIFANILIATEFINIT